MFEGVGGLLEADEVKKRKAKERKLEINSRIGECQNLLFLWTIRIAKDRMIRLSFDILKWFGVLFDQGGFRDTIFRPETWAKFSSLLGDKKASLPGRRLQLGC